MERVLRLRRAGRCSSFLLETVSSISKGDRLLPSRTFSIEGCSWAKFTINTSFDARNVDEPPFKIHFETSVKANRIPEKRDVDGILSRVHKNASPVQICQSMTWLSGCTPLEEVRCLALKASRLADDFKHGDEVVSENDENLGKMFILLKCLSSVDVAKMETKAIVSCLKAANELGLTASNSFSVMNMENTLTWKARKCKFKELTFLLSFAHKRKAQSEDVPKCTELLYNEVVRTIERRWVEVDDGKSLVGILHYYPDTFGEQFVGKLEDRGIEIAAQLSAEELVVVLKTLAAKKRRTVPLLRAITYHLAKKHESLAFKDLADVLYCLKQLTYNNSETLETLCEVAERRLDTSPFSSAAVRSVLTILGQMKFKHEGLLDKMASLLVQQDVPDDRDLLAFLFTTATLNYLPKDSQQLYDAIANRLERSSLATEELKRDLLWLDIVWSLTVLERALPSHFKSVLSAEFYNKILYSQDARSNIGNILKLLNVNAAAIYCHGEYDGPSIRVRDDPLLSDVRRNDASDKGQLAKLVMDAMNVLAAAPNFLTVDVNTLMGFVVEGMAVFDKRGKPLALRGIATLNDETSLPDGASRVCVMVLGYHDFLLGGGELTGLARLCKRLLEARGVKVLLVKHTEIRSSQKSLEKVKILEAKLNSLLNLS